MLTHRTNLLLSENQYKKLNTLAKRKQKTVGALIRTAIDQTYKVQKKEKSQRQLFNEMRKIFADFDTTDLDIKALVEEGRRY